VEAVCEVAPGFDDIGPELVEFPLTDVELFPELVKVGYDVDIGVGLVPVEVGCSEVEETPSEVVEPIEITTVRPPAASGAKAALYCDCDCDCVGVGDVELTKLLASTVYPLVLHLIELKTSCLT